MAQRLAALEIMYILAKLKPLEELPRMVINEPLMIEPVVYLDRKRESPST